MSENDIAIKVENVSKVFLLPHEKNSSLKSAAVNIFKSKDRRVEKQHALKDISFEVKKGEFFGIVGRNGSGKSTLLKILAGIYQPTKGRVHINGRLVPFIELGVGFNPELTGRENVYLNGALLGFSRKEIAAKYENIIEFAELKKFMDQKLKNYSSGMQVRLAFSVATILAESDVLLIDEVLAVGDADFQRKCFDYFKSIKKQNKTVVFVSHDMNSVKEYCDRAILIVDGRISESGDSAKVAEEYTKLFIDSSSGGMISCDYDRWGDGDVIYDKVSSRINNDKLIIHTQLKVIKPVDKIVYGVHVISADGKEVFAMNNKMVNLKSIENPKTGDRYSVEWTFPNILSDGKYTVTVTIVDDTGRVLDWQSGSSAFKVLRSERSTTAILPQTHVNITKLL